MKDGYKFKTDESGLIYSFISEGPKGSITKLIQFDEFDLFFNCALGDVNQDSPEDADFEVESNNGDIMKVLRTAIRIIEHFSKAHPGSNIFISGFDTRRKNTYQYMLMKYLESSEAKFDFLGWKKEGDHWEIFDSFETYDGLLAVPTE